MSKVLDTCYHQLHAVVIRLEWGPTWSLHSENKFLPWSILEANPPHLCNYPHTPTMVYLSHMFFS